ncbi:chromosome partitioning protein ParB [Corynebacterium sp. HMSC04H06]|uniref:chromosome partitioning protein ParB n=1 Tax=Corynebacterium sp. HMSC04H06 TaxID=1581050 RepID=UPI001FF03D2F|nr:chromosome partitioning protein ParB [Corynebacterium sp. HMSC04H06]
MTFPFNPKKGIASALAAAMVTTGAAAPAAQANELDSNIQGPLVLAEAMYYDAGEDEIRLDEGKIDHDRVTAEEVDQVEAGLADLTDEQIDQVLIDNGYEPDEMRDSDSDNSGVSFRIAPAIIWGGVAILGILTGGGLIFYSMYTTHAEKQNLINQCYQNGGNPVVDSRDSAGVEGTTDSGAAKNEGGYRFECQK